ncbi:hypothetical protein BAPA111461_26225 [Bacillus paramycoides]
MRQAEFLCGNSDSIDIGRKTGNNAVTMYYKGDIAMADIKFEIKENVGVLSQSPKGWTKELNLISWNGKEAKYDLRDWAPNHEKMGKGITLTVEELKTLNNVLNSVELK